VIVDEPYRQKPYAYTNTAREYAVSSEYFLV